MKRRVFFQTILGGAVGALLAPLASAKLKLEPTPRVDVETHRTLLSLKKDIEEGCKYFLFEPNHIVTRTRIMLVLSGMLEKYKETRVINDYSVICDETNNPDDCEESINVSVHVRPSRSVSYTIFNVSLTATKLP
jgi:hypothetical protein